MFAVKYANFKRFFLRNNYFNKMTFLYSSEISSAIPYEFGKIFMPFV